MMEEATNAGWSTKEMVADGSIANAVSKRIEGGMWRANLVAMLK